VSLNCELGVLKVLTFVTGYEFCNLLGLKVCPAALGGSWFYTPFEGVTVKPPALPVVLDFGSLLAAHRRLAGTGVAKGGSLCTID